MIRNVVVLAGSLFVALMVSSAHAAVGTIQFVNGEVTLTTASSTVSPASRGTPVNVGDVIATGNSGVVHVAMNDGAMLSLRPRSQFRIEEYPSAGTGKKLMQLFHGGLRALTRKLQTRGQEGLTVRTATVVIGVRGTDHEVYHVQADNEIPGARAGTYDRVYAGGTTMSTSGGQLDLEAKQVGFAGYADRPPVLLDNVPDFLAATVTRMPSVKLVGEEDGDTLPLPGSTQPFTATTFADAATPFAVMQSIGGTTTYSNITNQTIPQTETLARGGTVNSFSTSINFSTLTMTSLNLNVTDAANRNWVVASTIPTGPQGTTFDKLFIPISCTGCTFAPTNSTMTVLVQGANGGSVFVNYRLEAAGTITEMVKGAFTATR